MEPSGLKKIYAKVNPENADDLIFRNHALLELGQLYLEKCDFPNSMDCLEKVKTEALQFHLYDNYFRAVALLLRIHSERLDFSKQESLLREALQVGSSLTAYQRYAPKLHYNQGISAVYKKNFVEAQKHFVDAKQELERLLSDPSFAQKDREELERDHFNVRYSLAVNEKDFKRFAEALSQADQLLKEIEDRVHGERAMETLQLSDTEASLHILRGQCYRELGDLSKSLDCYWKAHSILKVHRNWNYYYYVLLGLGRTYLALGNTERAQIFFDLIADSISNLELNALKQALDRVAGGSSDKQVRLMIDRERKVVIEKTLGEIHFERRFVLLEILYLVASQPGKVFSKEELVDTIWRESYNPMIHDSKVYTSISRLRKLIEPDFKRPIYILNERDGYAFNPAVRLEEVGSRMRGGGPSQVDPGLRRGAEISAPLKGGNL